MKRKNNHLQYVFPDKSVLVGYVYANLDSPTDIRVQNSLYLAWAYYSASFGVTGKYPKYLFKPCFRAYRYGPVDIEVFAQQKQGNYNAQSIAEFTLHNCIDKNIRDFLDQLISKIRSVNGFGLVSRVRQDSAYRNVYVDDCHETPMKPKDIVNEYYYQKIPRYIVNEYYR